MYSISRLPSKSVARLREWPHNCTRIPSGRLFPRTRFGALDLFPFSGLLHGGYDERGKNCNHWSQSPPTVCHVLNHIVISCMRSVVPDLIFFFFFSSNLRTQFCCKYEIHLHHNDCYDSNFYRFSRDTHRYAFRLVHKYFLCCVTFDYVY
jgi:hypothetical protein